MISLFLTTLLVIDPLAATNSSDHIWFISDRTPGTPGPKYELSYCDSSTSFTTYLQLQHRPIAMSASDRSIWFVDQGGGVGLYRVLQKVEEDQLPTASLQAFLATDLIPIDIEIIGETQIVVCQTEILQCISFDGELRTLLPPLDSNHAFTAVIDNQLIAASQEGNSITTWKFFEETWRVSTKYEVEGKLADVIVKDDWPILVMNKKDSLEIIGLQSSHQELVATIPIPKGRWRLLVNDEGLVLLSVQRNGIVKHQDIGWPSGRLGKSVELLRKYRGITIFEFLMTLLTPLLLCVFLVMLIRRKK